ncbi:MAG: hypothetical protein ACOVQE_01850 [Chitinophagaceae bacterium]
MKQLISLTVCLFAIFSSSKTTAQELSVKDKLIKVTELPEYVVINSDNATGTLSRTIRIAILSKFSATEKELQLLQEILDDKQYLGITNQTDLLNAMSKLGFDFLTAFPQNLRELSSESRTGFVFRKKEKYRNEQAI